MVSSLGENFPATGKAEFEMAKARNARWIASKMKLGYDIYDIGIDTRRTVRSPFYQLEKKLINENGYEIIPFKLD